LLVEVELYKIKERINNLFFGVLLIDAQIEQVQFLIKDLQNGIDKINTAIANGVALPSAAQNLQAEKLRAEQRIIELRSNKNAFLAMISQFIGKSISGETIFEKPNVLVISENINRPELALFDLEKNHSKYKAI